MDMYEEERLAALEERRKEEAQGGPDRPSLEARFGPGSFGCHEALHVTELVVDLIERAAGAAQCGPAQSRLVRAAQGSAGVVASHL